METPREKRKKRKKRVVLAVSQKKNSQKGRSEERNQLTMAARQDNVYEDDTSEQLPLSEGLRLLVCPKAVACLRLLSPDWLVYQQALRPGSEIAILLGDWKCW